MKTRLYIFAQLICVMLCFADAKLPFEFQDGDRVVFLGDTLMEREQYHGYIELALATHSPKCKVTFRNLGWSADTPEGSSRFGLSLLQAGHEPADEGWNRLLDQIDLVKPTVVFLGYGMANSFSGQQGIPKFIAGMNKLIDALLAKNVNTRFVLLSPIRHENLGSPLPDPARHNLQLLQYTEALRQLAMERGFIFISLFDDLKIETEKKARRPLTDNGIHLNALGYQKAAETIEKGLGWKAGQWKRHPSREFLREALIKKNAIWFNRSRPQNMAYLYGFRKHEQGKNAKEIPEFDRLIAAEEEAIWNSLQSAWLKKSKTPSLQKTSSPAFQFAKNEPQSLPEFKMADGLEVNLWAESPMLTKPIQINFDAQGRLWVASSEMYPQVAPGQASHDKIFVLEDTNADGRADKSTVFVDGLLIPTAVIPGNGGVYVGQSTDLLFFKDTNGDGKADEQRRVLSGFGTEDSHHNIHTLRWGPDGHLYFNQSIYIRTDTETPNGVLRLKSGGILNLHPQTMDLETFLYGFCNSWGHAFDEFGQSFTTDGCGGQGISYGLRGATYFTFAGMRREMKSISPGSYPKFCGLEMVRSEHFPADWQNNLVTSDFRAQRVVRFKITEDNAGFAAQELSPEIMRTTNTAFRPIDAKIGPDGALYIADWSNPIINHGEVDFRDPRRDHSHGRIWRVSVKNRPLLRKPKLATWSNYELLNELLSPNDFNRNQARRLLTERNGKIKKDLEKWAWRQIDEKAQLEALWLYQSIHEFNPHLLRKVLAAKDGRIRAAAVRVAAAWKKELSVFSDGHSEESFTLNPSADSPFYDLLSRAVIDPHPRVRLEAVRALAKVPSARSAELVLSALNQPMDNFLDYGIWLSINDLAQPWVEAVKSGAWKLEGREKQLEFALKAISPELANSILESVLTEEAIPKDGSGPWIELIAKSGSVKDLTRLFDQTVKGDFNPAALVRAVNALEEASRLRSLKPAGKLENIEQLLNSKNTKVSTAAIKLMGSWKLEKFIQDLVKLARNESTSEAVRNAAFDSLRQIGGVATANELLSLTEQPVGESIRQQALKTAANVDFDKALPRFIDFALLATNENTSLDLWRSILGIKNAGRRIARALPGEIPLPVAQTALKVAREGGRNESELVLALSRSANLDDAEKMLTTEELKQLADSISGKGDPAKGEMLYRNANLGCLNCHAVGGAGGKVGPDLTSIGASAPLDYLIESTLYPNKKIKEGYHSIVLSTRDEQEYSGIQLRETDTEVVLRDAANKEISVAKNNVESRKNGLSLMPSGLIDTLSETERTDLFRFLSELGKPGPFDASKGNVARVWKVFVVYDDDKPTEEKVAAGDFGLDGWLPGFSTVAGKMLKGDLQAQIETQARPARGIYAATKLQLANAGSIRLKLTGAEKPRLWIDGKLQSVNSDVVTELGQGKHTIVMRLDGETLPDYFRLETSEGTFLVE